MIQNVLEQEYISSVMPGREKSTGNSKMILCKYMDETNENEFEFVETKFEDTINEERSKMICVGVPGLSEWVHKITNSDPKFSKELKVISYVRL